MMGRLLAAVACLIACVLAPVSVAGDINPAHWPKHQWRSDLFDTYPQHRRHRRVYIIKQEIRIRIEPARARTMAAARVPSRPLLIRNGAAMNPLSAPATPGKRPACDGVLVVTWMGDHARSTCHRGRATPRH